MRRLLAPLLFIVLVGCVGMDGKNVTPDTPRERLAAAEVTYKAAVDTAASLVTQGVVKPGTSVAVKVKQSVVAARAALDAWHVNPDASDKASLAITALGALQAVLTSFAPTTGG